MAFQSDSVALRTWDPDTGWELHAENRGIQYRKFVLKHPEFGSIEFQGEHVEVVDLPEQLPNGRAMSRKTFRIFFVNSRTRVSEDEQRHLIQDALVGFGIFFNGPSGPVTVEYDP